MIKKMPLEDDLDEILQLIGSHSMRAIAQIMSERKGYEITYNQVRALLRRNHIHKERTKAERCSVYSRGVVFPEDFDDYIRDIAPGRSWAEIIRLCNEAFDEKWTTNQIRGYAKRNNIRNGLDGRIPPGGDYRSALAKAGPHPKNSGQFKSGNRPATTMPIGTALKRDGYWIVKTAEHSNVKKAENWTFMHRLIWEEHHGPIPGGWLVIFLDGDHDNLDPDNLKAVSPEIFASLNLRGLRFNNADMTRAGITIAQIERQINDAKKKGKSNNCHEGAGPSGHNGKRSKRKSRTDEQHKTADDAG